MRIIKPKEAAEFLNCHYDTLRRMERNGVLVAHRSPTNRRFYTLDQLQKFVNKEEKRKFIKFKLDEKLLSALKKRSFSSHVSMAEYCRQCLSKDLFSPTFKASDSDAIKEDKFFHLLQSLSKKIDVISDLYERISVIESILTDLIDDTMNESKNNSGLDEDTNKNDDIQGEKLKKLAKLLND